ncbi:steroid receptor rna activator (sra1) [Holotrichia oblita]|uniref:Steroid receptor rna activator (Sra1) n=1 Tax=Holotrichia oblita TaxID=644536 RepID=A0ACB9T1R0_HOLOL|nr:steroid receptor rna activator (sra1) [Holotrichia oblita]
MPPPPISVKKVDPGWNDPPTLNYTASNPPPKSRITNKRVAFPLSSNQSSPLSPGLSQAKLPPTAMTPPALEQLAGDHISSTVSLKEVLLNVETVLNDVGDSDFVKSKLDVLEVMWKEKKLNPTLQKLVLDMSRYIADGNMEKANEIQLKLMMEEQSLCEPWLVGFKHLISLENPKK